jgi:hypothetical protein
MRMPHKRWKRRNQQALCRPRAQVADLRPRQRNQQTQRQANAPVVAGRSPVVSPAGKTAAQRQAKAPLVAAAAIVQRSLFDRHCPRLRPDSRQPDTKKFCRR